MKTYLFLLQKSNYWILKLLVIASISINQSLHAQLIEDFSDNDFTNNPTWTGSTADFIVNTNQQLQLNANTGGQSYLVTSHLLDNLNEKVWQFWVRQNFAGSASNFGRIYLIAEQEDLSTNPDGIYIQLGEALATDAVRLMQQNSGTTTQICASADGTIAAAFQIGISVKRLTTGIWELSVDFNGSTNYSFVDSGIEIQIPTGDYFGYQCTYTAGNSTRFYLDNIYVGDEIIDTDPPILQTVVVIDNYNLDVLFSEEITSSSAENNANYELIPFNSIATATLDVTNQALVHLQLTSPLVNGNTYTLTTEAIEDLNGNSSSSQSINFVYLIAEQPTPGDVIINEFMADPSPVIGLPEVEFVEIYNRSSKIFNLAGWKLGDNTSFGTVATSNWLLPGEYRVLAPNTSVSLFTNAVGVTSFPSLNNASDDIKIADNNGNIIDALSYTTDWYHDASKANGGWTIERINPQTPCSDILNWKASIDSSGGTPGFQNTVFSLAPDSIVPIINQCMAVSSNTIRVVFNKPIDSLSIQNSIISINPSLTIIDREVETTFTTETFLTTQEPINYSTIYTIKITGFEDCSGQTGNDSTTFILPSIAAVGDILINEFMADPSPAVDLPEVEFVEIYNVSNKIIDLSNWKLGDNTTFGSFNGGIIYPNEYKVLTANSNVGQFTNSIGVTNFPSLNNTEDDIVIQNGQGTVIDKISYTTTWYQDNSKKDGGWSIERINPFAPCQSSNNWRASIDLTGGTPGFVNSVLDTFPDYSLPEIVSIEVITDQHIAIYFNKNIDSNALQNVQIFTNPSLTITYLFIPEKFTSYASIYFMEPLISSKIYTLTINGLTDCWGNENNVSENFILPSNPEVGEVIINEILFDQLTGGGDWIELYNKSDKIIDLKGWKFARYTNEEISDVKTYSKHRYLYPDDYVVVGSDSNFVINNYPASVLGKFINLTLPTLPNDTGSIIVLFPYITPTDTTDQLMDELIYSAKWHFKLLDSKDGKALERRNPDLPTQEQSNWHTAAENVGFATPGGKNSQYFPSLYTGQMTLANEVISPDNDGFEDLLQVNYQMETTGMLATVSIFDDKGRCVKTICQNELLGIEGVLTWDGIREDGQKALIGTYIILMEAFDIHGGNQFVAKKAFVVAGKM